MLACRWAQPVFDEAFCSKLTVIPGSPLSFFFLLSFSSYGLHLPLPTELSASSPRRTAAPPPPPTAPTLRLISLLSNTLLPHGPQSLQPQPPVGAKVRCKNLTSRIGIQALERLSGGLCAPAADSGPCPAPAEGHPEHSVGWSQAFQHLRYTTLFAMMRGIRSAHGLGRWWDKMGKGFTSWSVVEPVDEQGWLHGAVAMQRVPSLAPGGDAHRAS
ncbi:unnamed protein product [Arctogadus glacialis]